GQARAIVIAGRREEDLRLVLQTPECLAVDDAIAIALKRRTDVVFGLRPQTTARVGALGRLRRENLALPVFQLSTEIHKQWNAEAAEAAEQIILCGLCELCVLDLEVAEKADAMRERADAEDVGERPAEIGERRSRAEVGAGAD